jgi:hypothetical protein
MVQVFAETHVVHIMEEMRQVNVLCVQQVYRVITIHGLRILLIVRCQVVVQSIRMHQVLHLILQVLAETYVLQDM